MNDLVVIGGGPGGYVAAIRARQLGMSVCLIEKDVLGGTCLNRGCIPTKAYYQNAAVLNTLARLSEFSVRAENISFDLAGARERKDKVVARLSAGIGELLRGNQVDVIRGEASITAPGRVSVSGQGAAREIESGRILIATGSEPSIPAIPGADTPGVIDSDAILDLDAPPQRLVIIGGGVIGIEFACIFNAFGSRVTVLEFLPEALGVLDREIIKRMRVALKKQRIDVQTQVCVERIERRGEALVVTARGKKGDLSCEADAVLLAAGRRPRTGGLHLQDLGVACERGAILVDPNYETNVPGLFAIGDAIPGPMLAHVASEEGIVAVERMTGLGTSVNYDAIPACVFSFPEIATVGLSQEEAEARGIAIRTGRFPFTANGKALTMGETDGLVKVVADDSDLIIGIHIIGPHASDLIQEASVIVKNRLRLGDVIGTVHPHPTLGEAMAEAVMDAAGRSIHTLPRH
jgi:dihydrolipoamide dehydrogenase